jgi:hypothetical protein
MDGCVTLSLSLSPHHCSKRKKYILHLSSFLQTRFHKITLKLPFSTNPLNHGLPPSPLHHLKVSLKCPIKSPPMTKDSSPFVKRLSFPHIIWPLSLSLSFPKPFSCPQTGINFTILHPKNNNKVQGWAKFPSYYP